MKAVVYDRGGSVSARRRATTYRPPPVGSLYEPVLITDHMRMLTNVRLLRTVVRDKGRAYQGSPLTEIVDVYLDGLVVAMATTDTGNNIKDERTVMPAREAIGAARTNQTLDFGRFDAACRALITQIDQHKAAGDKGDDKQEELIYRGYQGLMEWRAALQREVDAADANLDVVAAKVRAFVL